MLNSVERENFERTLIREERSLATVKKYCRDVDAFLAFAGGREISKETAMAYKEWLLERYAPASVNSMLAAMNRFFRETGRYDCVVKSVKVQRQTFREGERELTKAEYYRLLDAARQKNDQRLFLLMQTLCATGIRISELRFITVEAARQGRGTVKLKGKLRQVLLPRALSRELLHYAQQRGIDSGSIFITRSGKPMDRSNVLHAMKALCEEAHVDSRKVFPHNLRHLFACLYYREVKDLCRLADLLGHSNLNTTRIYTSLSGSEQQLQLDRLGLVVQRN